MRLLKSIPLLILVAITMAACSASKQIPYLQNSDNYNFDSVKVNMYDARIMPKDELSITINTSDPQVSLPFNLAKPTVSTTSTELLSYLVSNQGDIILPIIGEIKVSGLTTKQAEELIISKLTPYLKETPIVRVRINNFDITIVGEVSKPGRFTITDQKINVFEAVAMAGDLTIYGKRTNVKIIREDEKGQKSVAVFDLTKTDIIDSPYYYLQQNDIVYVTPNKVKANSTTIGSSTTIWFSVVSSLISLTSFIIMLISL